MSVLSEDDSYGECICLQVPDSNANRRQKMKSPKMYLHIKINLSEKPSTSKTNQFQYLKVKLSEKENKRPPPLIIHYMQNLLLRFYLLKTYKI